MRGIRGKPNASRRVAAGARPIVIYGTKGFAREVQQIIKDIGPALECIGFLVDSEYQEAAVAHGLPVLGDVDWLQEHPAPLVAIGIGATTVRRRIVDEIGPQSQSRFMTLTHPRAYVGDTVTTGTGCIINVGACATTDIVLGSHVQLHAGCTVAHDAIIGDFVTVATGAKVLGRVVIGEGAFIGAGAVILPDIKIGPWSTIGAGAVVTRDVPANATVAGVPARVIGRRDPG